MCNTLNFIKEKKYQSLIIFSITFLTLFTISCGQESQSSKKPESELIKRVKAVQQQIMIQGNVSEEEELALKSLSSLFSQDDSFGSRGFDGTIVLKDIEYAPIYNGCERLSEDQTKKCFKKGISEFIKQEFNSSIVNALDNSEPKQVAVFFVIDKNGNLSGMKIRDTELTIQAEIARVLKKIPKMKPATQEDVNVSVLCSMLVTYGSELKIELMYIPEGGLKN